MGKFKHPNFLPLAFVVVLGILASRTLLFQSGYFNMHDDLQMMRQLQMEKCFEDSPEGRPSFFEIAGVFGGE